jgi:phosphoribosylformylglycinamidine cyclo-ligase
VDGDVVIALESSGLHSNGFSLVRHIVRQAQVSYLDRSAELGGLVGEVLLEPTRLYTVPLLGLLADAPGVVHALSHVTGGGIAANLARVLPVGSWVELERSTWSPAPVFRVLTDWGSLSLEETEGTWNLGIGMIAVVEAASAGTVIAQLSASGIPAWSLGVVSTAPRDNAGFDASLVRPADSSARSGPADWVQGAKGVDGGAVRLVGRYRD